MTTDQGNETTQRVSADFRDNELILVKLPRKDFYRLEKIIQADEEQSALIAFISKVFYVLTGTLVTISVTIYSFWDKVANFFHRIG